MEMKSILAMENNREQGITLVALIITIIVLIILAAVSIIAVSKTKFIEVALNSSINYAKKQNNEMNEMDYVDDLVGETVDRINNNGKTSSGDNEDLEQPEEPAPTVETVTVKTEWMDIQINATIDEEMTRKTTFNYEIIPASYIDTVLTPAKGTITTGETIAVKATDEREYTIKITATDGNGNETTDTKTEKIMTTMRVLSIAEVKQVVNANTLKDYIGAKVDYNPAGGGTWRVFYQDNEDQGDGLGYFGDKVGTIYLKRDYDLNLTKSLTNTHKSSDDGALMKQMNPLWRDSDYSTIDLDNEKAVSYLCDPKVWESNFKTDDMLYAMGSPSIELFIKSLSTYRGLNTNYSVYMKNRLGYGIMYQGKDTSTLTLYGSYIPIGVPEGLYHLNSTYQVDWLASPGSKTEKYVCCAMNRVQNRNSYTLQGYYYTNTCGLGPIVAIKS